jgi:hypothetical protein
MTTARDTESRIRAGWRPSIADKIRATGSAEELDGFLAALRARAYQMTADDVAAVRDARRILGGGAE